MIKRPHKGVVTASIAVFAVVAAVLALVFSTWWLLLIFLPIFSLPVLREISVVKDIDERQKLNCYRSSHLTFYIVLFFLLALMVGRGLYMREEIDPAFTLVIVYAVIVKVGSNLILNHPQRQAGIIIGLITGAWWLLFAMFSHGLTLAGLVESSIGLAILAATALAFFLPPVSGALLVLGSVISAVMTFLNVKDLTLLLYMMITMPLPLIIAGLLILSSVWRQADEETAESQGRKRKR